MTTPDPSKGEQHWWPEFLPGGKAAVFDIWKGTSREIGLLILQTGEYRVLLEGGSHAQFSRSGHIVYASEGRLMAQSFDLERLELKGEPVPVLEGVNPYLFSLSLDGSLAYVPASGLEESTVMWVDRKGQSRPLTEIRGSSDQPFPRLSPDGKRLALTISTDNRAHIWLYDLERDALTRLSSGTMGDDYPVWTPDGTRITYCSGSDIVWQAVDGAGAAEMLTRGTNCFSPDSWSPDGRELVSHGFSGGFDIWVLSLEGDRKPRPFLQTPAMELGGAFSPDGQWIAYVSDESGRVEVYIRPYPGPGGKWQVSTAGGVQPAWSRSGREIFYRNEDQMMSVAVENGPAFHLSKPRLLFEGRFVGGAGAVANGSVGRAQYDVAPDGEHFAMVRSEKESAPARIHVVLNWAEELKAKVPPAGAD